MTITRTGENRTLRDIRRSQAGSRNGQAIAWVVLAAAGLGAPYVLGVYQLQLAVQGATLGMLALSIGWLMRQTGLLSFGQAAYYGIAAYATAYLATETNLPVLLICLIAVALSSAFSLLVALVTVRFSGVTFAMLSLAVGMLAWVAAGKLDVFTHGTDGFTVSFQGDLFGQSAADYIDSVVSWPLVWSCLTGAMAVLWLVSRSRFGRRLAAIRENDERLRFSGYRTYLPKVYAFVIAAMIASVAGVISLLSTSFVSTESLSFQASGLALIVAIIGGIGRMAGPPLGAMLFIALQAGLAGSSQYQLVMGLLLMVVVIFAPQGVLDLAIRGLAPLVALARPGKKPMIGENRA